ncbi:MAG TPA: hypothetical protein VN442_02035 [Bryobacteraceae bacterium]|nr:hypothetical protein [Bryobacteraceae bacterium]
MSVRWSMWQAELERISPFAEEWNPGLAEDFLRGVQDLVGKKRAQREAVEKLAEELRFLRTSYTQTLAFFDLERACEGWSAANCPGAEVERVIQLLAQWRGNLLRYNGVFPPAEEKVRSYMALHEWCLEAEAAMAAIRPGFGALNNLLAPPKAEVPAPEPPAETVVAAPAPTEVPTEPESGIAVALGQIGSTGVWLKTEATDKRRYGF